tara:strand:+ start:2043 stop:2162 length:120 start_codon:yes stop_codon:yes gene_type:complete
LTLKSNASDKEREDFENKSNADLAFVLLPLDGALIALDK